MGGDCEYVEEAGMCVGWFVWWDGEQKAHTSLRVYGHRPMRFRYLITRTQRHHK
jgi:hypothetical protein